MVAAERFLTRGRRAGAIQPSIRGEGEGSRAKIAPAELLKGMDLELFQLLSQWRRKTADAAAAPAFVIFGDRTLIDLAQRRPSDEANLRLAYGMGAQKIADYGNAVLEIIDRFCRDHQLERNCQPAIVPVSSGERAPSEANDSARLAWPHFEQGKSCAEVAPLIGRGLNGGRISVLLSKGTPSDRPQSLG